MRVIQFVTIFLLYSAGLTSQTTPSFSIRMNDFKCSFADSLKHPSEQAFELINKIFDSQEFKDSLSKLSFSSSNYCNGFKNRLAVISGQSILNELQKHSADSLKLIMKWSNGALGETVPFKNYTTAYYSNIKTDMCNLPFFYALSVNLCHEYMHHIGYCHPRDPKDRVYRKPKNGNACEDELYDPISYSQDIAYRVGWIVYDMLWLRIKQGLRF